MAVLLLGGTSARGAMNVTLSWSTNTEANVVGYKVYFGTNRCQGDVRCRYAGSIFVLVPATTCTLNNVIVAPAVTNYFAVTAVTLEGFESARSVEASYPKGASGPDLIVTEHLVEEPNSGPVPIFTETEVQAPPPPTPGVDVEPPPIIDPRLPSGVRLEIIPYGQPVMAFWLRFTAPASKDCELQFSDDLQTWQALIPFRTGPTAEPMEFVDVPSSACRYYRLAIH